MNNIVFNADLSTLTLNNNCLIKTVNNNQNVVNISYTINFESNNSYTLYPKYDSIGNDIGQEPVNSRTIPALTAKCNSLSNCRGFNDNGWIKNIIKNKLDNDASATTYIRNGMPTLGARQVFKNTLNMTNANSINTLIFSYVFIPTDQFYKFRVVTSNNSIYTGPCRIYLNNYQTVIFDSYIHSNETQYEVIKKGTYMICIDLPKRDLNDNTVIPVSFEYISQNIGSIHPDRISAPVSWTSLDNLLIKNCDTLLTDSNAWTLVNLFTNSANEYCKTNNNIITPVCTDYYNNIGKYTTQFLNEENLLNINKSRYPNIINGEYSDWSISDSNWTKDVKNLSVEYGSCGKNASRSKTRTYFPPRYGGNENRQNPHINDSQIRDVNCHTDSYVNTEWTTRGCNAAIPSEIKEAQFNSDRTTLTTELNKFTKIELIKQLKHLTQNTFLSICYQDWMNKPVSSFTLNGGDENGREYSNTICTNVCYMNGYQWSNADFKLIMQTDGNLVSYASNGTVLWSTDTYGNPNARLCAQRDGRLVIYKADGTEIWSYDCNKTAYIPDNTYTYQFTSINQIIAVSSITNQGIYGQFTNIIYPNIFYMNGYSWSFNDVKLVMQTDGNLVIYNSSGNPDWSSRTFGNLNAKLCSQRDGNLVIYTSDNKPIWASGTNTGKPSKILLSPIQNKNYLIIYNNNSSEILAIYPNLANSEKELQNFILAIRQSQASISPFTNKKIILSKKSNFLSNINNALPYNTQGKIVENFINPICNLTNILNDPNCSGDEYDIYKEYVTSMDNYCNENPLLPICTSYITKEIISLENPENTFKINEENKIKILTKQESLCSNKTNYLDPRCISINSKKPEIIQKQSLELDRGSQLYKQLAVYYGNELDYQTCLIDNNIIEKYKDICQKLETDSEIYSAKLKNKRLEVCKQDSNIIHKECIELNKREQFPVITEYCAKDTNLLKKECLDFNKEYKLNEVKEQCKDNKTDNCKQLCTEYKEDFNDICFWENNQIYFILAFIALIIIGSVIGYFKFKNRKKTTPALQDSQQVLVLQAQQTQNTQPVYADSSVAYIQGMPWGMQQGMQQGMPWGMQQGMQQGMPWGMQQGMQQGMPWGMQQGIYAENSQQ